MKLVHCCRRVHLEVMVRGQEGVGRRHGLLADLIPAGGQVKGTLRQCWQICEVQDSAWLLPPTAAGTSCSASCLTGFSRLGRIGPLSHSLQQEVS